MPSNLVEINGTDELSYELGDSKMPALMQFLSTFTRVPEEGDTLDTQFGKLMREMAKAHYGEDFEFTKCVIELDVENGIDVTTFDIDREKIRSFEPPVTEEEYERITGE